MLLNLNQSQTDGLTGRLFDTISGVCLRLQAKLAVSAMQLCKVSEPSCWVMRVKRGKWFPSFVGLAYAEDLEGGSDFPPSALITE